nr:PaaI family thioesterase [Aeromicrobium duanguangcaii]
MIRLRAPGYRDQVTDTQHPFLSTIGAPTHEAADGKATLTMDAGSEHLNPAGTVHGGMLATLVDTTMGAAILSIVDDEVPATSQLTVTYLRPGKPGPLTVTATVRKRGDRLTICEAEIEQDGKSLVHALATFALKET